MAALTDEKSGDGSGRFVPGYDPRRGHGPAPGAPNAGRPPDALKRRLEEILASPEVMGTLETILKHGGMSDARLWAKVWSVVWDKVYGRPPQTMQLDGEMRHAVMVLPRRQPNTAEEWMREYAPQYAARLPAGVSRPVVSEVKSPQKASPDAEEAPGATTPDARLSTEEGEILRTGEIWWKRSMG